MGSFGGEGELVHTLIEAGNSLLNPPSSTDRLLSLLGEIEILLSNVEQDPPESMQDALLPSMKALISADLLRHPDADVRVSVVSCLTEITRITAPEAPYDDEQMKEIFELTVEALRKLEDPSSYSSYKKAELILDTVSKVRLCLVMLDLDCNNLILLMFQHLLKIISPDHPQAVFLAIEVMMITVIDESEHVSMELLDSLLACVKKEHENNMSPSWRLVEKVLSKCARKLKPHIAEALKCSGDTVEMYSPVVSSICQSEYSTTKKAETDEKKRWERQSDSMEETLDLGISRNQAHSGDISRCPKQDVRKRTGRNNETEKRSRRCPKRVEARRSSKEGEAKSTDATNESRSGLKKKGQKPNLVLNEEEGYDHSWVSGGSNSCSQKLYKRQPPKQTPLPEETMSLPSKVGETSRSIVISLPTPNILRKSCKQSRNRRGDLDQGDESCMKETSSTRAKQEDPLSLCSSVKVEILDDEEYLMTMNEKSLSKTEDGQRDKLHNRLEKADIKKKKKKKNKKKSLTGVKMVKTNGERLVTHSDGKRKSEGDDPRSSKSKKIVSSGESPERHAKRKRTARKEMDMETAVLDDDLVGKKIKVWWPLDKTFYEGVVDLYCKDSKKHRVLYSDGETEMLNLKRQRWELIEDIPSAKGEEEEKDAVESMTLSGILQRQRQRKSATRTSSSEIRPASKRRVKKELKGDTDGAEEDHSALPTESIDPPALGETLPSGARKRSDDTKAADTVPICREDELVEVEIGVVEDAKFFSKPKVNGGEAENEKERERRKSVDG